MTYKCLECGHIFEDGEEKRWRDCIGEYWGRPVYEDYSGCPRCRGEYDNTIPCKICGWEHLESEMTDGVCNDCLNEYRYDIDVCREIGKNAVDSIELSTLFIALFDREEIEEILFNALKIDEKIHGKIDCQKFIDIDKSWFAERLAEEVKKDENAKG